MAHPLINFNLSFPAPSFPRFPSFPKWLVAPERFKCPTDSLSGPDLSDHSERPWPARPPWPWPWPSPAQGAWSSRARWTAPRGSGTGRGSASRSCRLPETAETDRWSPGWMPLIFRQGQNHGSPRRKPGWTTSLYISFAVPQFLAPDSEANSEGPGTSTGCGRWP